MNSHTKEILVHILIAFLAAVAGMLLMQLLIHFELEPFIERIP